MWFFGYLHPSNVWNAAWFCLPYVLYCEADCVYAAEMQPQSHVIFWAWRRKEDAKNWNVMTSGCVRVSGEKGSLPKAPFCCVCVCVCECTFMCTHMWSRVHLCVGRRNPSSRFLSWASSCVPPAHNSQSRRRRVWPRQDPTHQRRLRRGASVSLPPQSSVCFNHSLNVTINPVHTHTHRRIFPHLSIQCVLVYLIWLGRSEPCICACQCGNVCVKSFGSFLNASLTKRSSGKCGFNAPSLLSSCFLSLSISQLHRLCFSVLSSLFPFNFIFLWFNLWKSFLLLLLAIPSRSNDSNLCCFLCILTICSLLESWHHHLHKKHCKLRMHIGLRFRM